MTGHFEAKKIAWRQTKDGLVLALSVHPDEMPNDLALAPLNTRYMIGYAEIGDDEKPIEVKHPSTSREPKANGSSKPFSSLPLSQQAAIRCGDTYFQEFLKRETAEAAAERVRALCEVASRSELKPNTAAGYKWNAIEAGYQQWLTDRQFAEAKR